MPDSGELANGFGWGTFSVIVCIVIALLVTCIVGKSSRYPELVCLLSMIIPISLFIFFFFVPKGNQSSQFTDSFYAAKVVAIILGCITATSAIFCLVGHHIFNGIKAIRISSQLEMERDKQRV
ncbi:hypothetical protein pb186bvf_003601 [Paramecium bursaria]